VSRVQKFEVKVRRAQQLHKEKLAKRAVKSRKDGTLDGLGRISWEGAEKIVRQTIWGES